MNGWVDGRGDGCAGKRTEGEGQGKEELENRKANQKKEDEWGTNKGNKGKQ